MVAWHEGDERRDDGTWGPPQPGVNPYRSEPPRIDDEEDPTMPSHRWGDDEALPLPVVPLWSMVLILLLLLDCDGG